MLTIKIIDAAEARTASVRLFNRRTGELVLNGEIYHGQIAALIKVGDIWTVSLKPVSTDALPTSRYRRYNPYTNAFMHKQSDSP